MNKYLWAEYRDNVGYPTIKTIVARNYTNALEKIAEHYSEIFDDEISYTDWDTLAEALEDFGVEIGDKLLDVEEL